MSFKTDLHQEEILSRYLDEVYKEKNLDVKRILDINQQHQGVDICVQHQSKEYFIDEKAQLHYLNKDLPTFTFELSYLKEGVYKKGWLFDERKKTQFYFLITGIFLKEGKQVLESHKDIEKLKITSVNRSKLIAYLEGIQLSETTLLAYDKKLRTTNSYGKNEIPELDAKKQGVIFFTEHLNEQPINLQLRLNYLIESAIAKKINYV